MLDLQDTDSVATLTVFDELEDVLYKCRLERYYNEYLDEWVTAISVCEYDEGSRGWSEIMHAGITQLDFTEDAAFKQIQSAIEIIPKLLLFKGGENDS